MSIPNNDLNSPLTGTELQDLNLRPHPSTPVISSSKPPSNFYTAGFLSRTFFAWTHYVYQKANTAPLKVSDVTGLKPTDKSSNLIKPLYTTWYGNNNKRGYYSTEHKVKPNALFYAVLTTNIIYIIILVIAHFFVNLLKYAQIFFYREMMLHFKSYHDPSSESKPMLPIYITGTCFILIKISKTFAHHQAKFYSQVLGVKTVNQVSALIYDKITRTSIFIKNQISEGELLNFIQSDADSLTFLYTSLPSIINVPFNFAVALYMLFVFFGKSFVFGFITLTALIAVIWIVQKKYLLNAKNMLYKKDGRMRITTHTFHILKILKLFGWEDEFEAKIKTKREDELTFLGRILNLTALRAFVNHNIPLMISMASIGGYTYLYGAMDITVLFTSIELVEQIATPLIEIPKFITDLIATMVSMERIQNFLTVKDIETTKLSRENKDKADTAVLFRNCDFGIKQQRYKDEDNGVDSVDNSKSNASDKVLLRKVDLHIKKGELVGVIGETGSGKTCLVNAILNNLELLNDNDINSNIDICVNGAISYACQDPWIMNGTIRDNIIFYNEFDEEKYEKVVNACQLKKDFESFANGDLTEIGSCGTNVSGGQRARIALARAIYKDADIYIFDDPISSVDTYVSMEIFHQAVIKCLPDKTRIFITHDVRNLSYMNRIVYVNKFEIQFNGKYDELLSKDFYKQLTAISGCGNGNKKGMKLDKAITQLSQDKVPLSNTVGKLIQDEDQVKGEVTWSLYSKFINIQGGYLFFFVLIVLTIGNVGSNVLGKIYVSNWTSSASSSSHDKSTNLYNFFIYTVICFIGVFIQFLKEFAIAKSNYKSNKTLHQNMIHSLIKAPINLFHDVVPIGQILNRVTHDLDRSREIIWMFDTILNSFIGLMSAVYVCYLYNTYSLYIAPVLMLLSYIVAKYFINAARDLSRLDGISRSPAVSLFSETVLGVTTIRTFNAEAYQKEKFHSRIDEHLSVMQYKYGSDNWFCMHLDMLSHLYLGFVVLYSATHIDMFTAESVGLLMKYSSQFSEQLLEVMEQSTKVEKSLISMERCDAYTHLPTENTKTRVNEDKELVSWPNKGEVTFNNFRMRYRPNCEIALKDISLHIQPGEKVGIVGRTGSGKSSLCLGMFRIVEALGGSIIIDGVDISTISLKKLRRSISIVPQEPFLLEGTLKDNLDPLNMYTEQEIMNVLKQVKFFDTMEASENMKEGIHTRIKEYGNNMSFGCRQLLCFARAILRKSKIIVLDEATSSVDQKTENVIQNAVDEMFKDSTVITIAHRIQTVRKCDRIIVMDNGKVVECGKPDVLINDKESKFYSLYYKNMQVV